MNAAPPDGEVNSLIAELLGGLALSITRDILHLKKTAMGLPPLSQ